MHHFNGKIFSVFNGFDNWPKRVSETVRQRLFKIEVEITQLFFLLIEPDMLSTIDVNSIVKAHAANYEKVPFRSIFKQIRP